MINSPVKVWRNQKSIVKHLGKTGEIVTWTLIRVPPGDFTDQAPYPVAVVAIAGGQRIEAQLVDWEDADLRIGQKVAIVVRRITKPNSDGVIPYGVKVKPI